MASPTWSTSSETIPPVPLGTSGGVRAVDRGHGGATTRRLRDNDDDYVDDVYSMPSVL